ncbi:MAG: cytochrome c maturation protein CcmE [Dehalococcoidia bacterium]
MKTRLRRMFSSRRARLIAILALATAAISVLAVSAAGSSLSYYATPDEFAKQIDVEGRRWRVGGRVIEGTIVEENGRPVSFAIQSEDGLERMDITYDGIKPNLFGPRAFVIVEGVAESVGRLHASSVIIKHESEFLTSTEVATPSN